MCNLYIYIYIYDVLYNVEKRDARHTTPHHTTRRKRRLYEDDNADNVVIPVLNVHVAVFS